MRYSVSSFRQILFGGIYIIGLSSCATFKTLDADLPLAQRMFVYSGTRLDWAAISNNDVTLRKMIVEPPRYPLADLPLSFSADTLFLPLAVSAEIFH